ncbi:unnamed protein product [Sphagnum jensenii]|uniref:Uncharacterized protein n=1 Tax=Sphagnum jensenii TaxID=128206 RepID=A0ABP0V7R4_9BRYO
MKSFVRRGYGRDSTGAAETRAALAGELCSKASTNRRRFSALWRRTGRKRLGRNVGCLTSKKQDGKTGFKRRNWAYDLENKKKADLEQLRQKCPC